MEHCFLKDVVINSNFNVAHWKFNQVNFGILVVFHPLLCYFY